MHFLKRGKAGRRERSRFASLCFFQFLCPWYPYVWEGRGGEARQVSIVRAKGTSQILPFGRSNCKANAGGLPCLSTIMVQDSWYWPCSVNPGQRGSLHAPVFSELRTLSSSGNHAALCWPESSSLRHSENSSCTFLCCQSLWMEPFLIMS